MVTRPHQKLFLVNNYCISTSVNCPPLAIRLWRRSPQITHTVSEAPLPLLRSELVEGRVWRISVKEILEKKGLGDDPSDLNTNCNIDSYGF